MITRQTLQHRRREILAIAARYGAHDVRIFGSVARGDAQESSDLDLLVRFDPDRTLFDHGGLIGALQDLLGVHVDVVDEDGMRPRFRAVVAKEATSL